MKPAFFKNQAEFRRWLGKNYNRKSEILVGYYKVKSGKINMTWSQSVDQALAFGWIDGIRRSIDKDSYCIRFTPRRPGSTWSDVNIQKAEKLIEQGLMTSTGLELYQNRKTDKSGLYSYENKPLSLPPEFEQLFKININAWEYFSKQPPAYKKTIYFWVLSAKQERTRLARLKKLILESEKKQRVYA